METGILSVFKKLVTPERREGSAFPHLGEFWSALKSRSVYFVLALQGLRSG